jgi:hypothetical protein
MIAPSMLLTPAVTWAAVDDHRFDITMSDRISATSRVFVAEQGRMVGFSTTDRWAALSDGLIRARWTTPIDGRMDYQGRCFPSAGVPSGTKYVRGRFIPESVEFNVPPGAS